MNRFSPLTKVELFILQDALIAYKYQSNCPKDKIKIIQKKLLKYETKEEQ